MKILVRWYYLRIYRIIIIRNILINRKIKLIIRGRKRKVSLGNYYKKSGNI